MPKRVAILGPHEHDTLPHPSDSPDARSAAAPLRDAGRFQYANGDRPLAGYTIKRGVGQGGFGEIYYATSDAGKDIALKLVRRNLDVELRGIRQCLNLKHPNLLDLYDIRQDDGGNTWVVMEYVADESLEAVLADKPGGLPSEECLNWIHGIGAGVAYLHDRGIVHRDLKPGNIFCDEGVVKIGDYGLAKFISCSRRSGQTESVGTVHYMAPEVANGRYGKEIDVYAMGVILYELLTGRVPFEGESIGEVLMKHLTVKPDVSTLAEPYRGVVARALEKDPALRYSSAAEMLAALPPPANDVHVFHQNNGRGAAATPVEAVSQKSIIGVAREKVRSFRRRLYSDPNGDRRRTRIFVIIVILFLLFGGNHQWPKSDGLTAILCVILAYVVVQTLRGTRDGREQNVTDAAAADSTEQRIPAREEIHDAFVEAETVSEEPILHAIRENVQNFRRALHETQQQSPALYVLLVVGMVIAFIIWWPLAFMLGVMFGVFYGGYRLAWTLTGKKNRSLSNSPGQSAATPYQRTYDMFRRRERSAHALVLKPPRERLAELFGSLLGSICVAATMCVVVMLIESFQNNPTNIFRPEQYAWLLAVSVVGSWAVLIPSKFWEGMRGDAMIRRFLLMVIGMAVGAAAFGAGEWFLVDLPAATGYPEPLGYSFSPSFYAQDGRPLLLAHVACFGTLFLLVRWWLQSDPLRSTRLSLWKLGTTVIVAGIVAWLWQFPQPWLPMVAGVISVSVQLASPWTAPGRRWQREIS